MPLSASGSRSLGAGERTRIRCREFLLGIREKLEFDSPLALRLAGVNYWALRTLKGMLRGRVDRNLARRRFASYLDIARL